MSEGICYCPTCKTPIEQCPKCNDYKPSSDKLCRTCWEDFSAKNQILNDQVESLKNQLKERHEALAREFNIYDIYEKERAIHPLKRLMRQLSHEDENENDDE